MSEVPELEDVPHIIQRISKTSIKHKDEPEPSKIYDPVFAGMKKGFLGQTVKKVNKNKMVTNLPLLKAKPVNTLVLPELKKAMKEDKLEDISMEEFRNELSSRLNSNGDISKVLENPLWLSILSEFQQDAEKAMQKYKNNESVKNTMLKLCNVFGESFLHMSSGSKSEEEQLLANLIGSPLVKEALLDPYVSRIMDLMKENKNDKVMRMLKGASYAQKKKIQVLIDHGLFTFQS